MFLCKKGSLNIFVKNALVFLIFTLYLFEILDIE